MQLTIILTYPGSGVNDANSVVSFCAENADFNVEAELVKNI